MIWAPEALIADSSAVTSVAVAEGLHSPTTSIPIFGRFVLPRPTIGSAQTAFSARIATFGVVIPSSFLMALATVSTRRRSTLKRNRELMGGTRNQYLYLF